MMHGQQNVKRDNLDVLGLLLTVGLFVNNISGQSVGPILRDIQWEIS